MSTENQSDDNSEAQNQDNQINNQNQDTGLTEIVKSALAESDRRAREAEQRARDLEDRLTQMNASRVTNQQEDHTVSDDEFWKAPAKNINDMLQRQVAPIKQELEQNKLQNDYVNLKLQYRSYDGFDKIEYLVDKKMAGKAPTHANMQESIRWAIGELLLSGGIPAPVNNAPAPVNNQNNNPAPNNPNNNNQAHLRPSRTVVTEKDKTPPRRQLNEFEKRLARENKMTDDEYLDMLDSNSTVKTWKK